jgi:BRCA1/BRCA2-containing complex subunit 3
MINEYKYCKLVKITIDAYSACLNHVLLTDSEEVMGLLLGQVKTDITGDQVITILSTTSISRKCKEKDRVEFDEMQIAKASELADTLSKEHNAEINIVGWYHSHPKITVPPSNVDLNTQYSQQYQGAFVGIIISCFNSTGTLKMIAFQTVGSIGNFQPHYIEIRFINESTVLRTNISNTARTYSGILRNLLNEEGEQFEKEIGRIDKEDSLNRLMLFNNRQILLTKIIQTLSDPFMKSLNCEMDNMKYYLAYIKELNNILRNSIKNYEDINRVSDDNDY